MIEGRFRADPYKNHGCFYTLGVHLLGVPYYLRAADFEKLPDSMVLKGGFKGAQLLVELPKGDSNEE